MRVLGHTANAVQGAVTPPWQAPPAPPGLLPSCQTPHHSFATHPLEDGYLSAVPACASPHLSASRTRQAGADRPSTAHAGTGRRELLGHKDVTTTMIYAHVLNRGSAAVRRPADRLPASPVPPKEIDCKILQPNSSALTPPAVGRAKYIQPVPAHPQNSDEGNRRQLLQP